MGHCNFEVVIGPAGGRAMVRAKCGVRMRMRVVSSTLSMYFLSDQPTSLLVWTWKTELRPKPATYRVVLFSQLDGTSSAYMLDSEL